MGVTTTADLQQHATASRGAMCRKETLSGGLAPRSWHVRDQADSTAKRYRTEVLQEARDMSVGCPTMLMVDGCYIPKPTSGDSADG